jgi:hypothetical protein
MRFDLRRNLLLPLTMFAGWLSLVVMAITGILDLPGFRSSVTVFITCALLAIFFETIFRTTNYVILA